MASLSRGGYLCAVLGLVGCGGSVTDTDAAGGMTASAGSATSGAGGTTARGGAGNLPNAGGIAAAVQAGTGGRDAPDAGGNGSGGASAGGTAGVAGAAGAGGAAGAAGAAGGCTSIRTVELIVDGGFDADSGYWTEESNMGRDVISGGVATFSALTRMPPQSALEAIGQTLTFPSSTISAELSWTITTAREDASPGWEFFYRLGNVDSFSYCTRLCIAPRFMVALRLEQVPLGTPTSFQIRLAVTSGPPPPDITIDDVSIVATLCE